MKIAIGCDHGGFDHKNAIKEHLIARGFEVQDFGVYENKSVDYPDIATKVCASVISGESERAILVCGTGIGMSIAANKVKGIRCALLSDVMSARMTREHNDTNMMAMGAAVVGQGLAFEIVKTWLETPFSHGERHQRRIDKVMAIEK